MPKSTKPPAKPAKAVSRPLTARQARFVECYVKELNATRAAAQAGYSVHTANEQGSRLLANVSVAAAIAVLRAQRTERLQIEVDVLDQELYRLCTFDIADVFDAFGDLQHVTQMPRTVRAAIAGMEVLIKNARAGDGVTDTIHKLKMSDKRSSIELMYRRLGLLVERVEKGGPGAFTDKTDAELDAVILELHTAVGRELAKAGVKA